MDRWKLQKTQEDAGKPTLQVPPICDGSSSSSSSGGHRGLMFDRVLRTLWDSRNESSSHQSPVSMATAPSHRLTQVQRFSAAIIKEDGWLFSPVPSETMVTCVCETEFLHICWSIICSPTWTVLRVPLLGDSLGHCSQSQ